MKLSIRLLTHVILGISLIVSLANAREPINITVPERVTLAADQLYSRDSTRHSATHQLALTVVYFTGSDWSRDAILEAIRNTAKILEQCGTLLRHIELVRVDAPEKYHYLDTPVSRELARTLQLAKPSVYFVTDTRHQPAFDAEAIGRGNSKTRPELIDTVWVTRATRDLGIALAHELVHVLLDSGEHVELPQNLMRDETTPNNTHLTTAQCAQMQNVGTGNGLMQAIKK